MKLARLTLIAALALAGTAHAQTMIGGGKNTLSFPIVISQPGSYKLAGNLSVPAGVSAVLIDATDVTLDLNGYTIQGPNKCNLNPGGPGVLCTLAFVNNAAIDAPNGSSTVRNGTVRGFAGNGVKLGPGSRVEALKVAENGGSGLSVGPGSVASGIVSTSNYSNGIYAVQSLVTDVTVSNNGNFGVQLSGASLLRGGEIAYNSYKALFGDSQSGYRDVVMVSAGGSYGYGAISLGGNLCGGVPC